MYMVQVVFLSSITAVVTFVFRALVLLQRTQPFGADKYTRVREAVLSTAGRRPCIGCTFIPLFFFNLNYLSLLSDAAPKSYRICGTTRAISIGFPANHSDSASYVT